MPYGTVNADVIGTSVANSNLGAGNATSFKNRMINGNCIVNQYATTYTVNNTEQYPVDRIPVRCNVSGLSATTAQNSTAPSGFRNSIFINVTTGGTPSGADRGYMVQKIEGYNVADFMLGTATAVTWTFSFWVRSSLTGTFSGSFQNESQNRSYLFTYTINTANTWEQKTITVTGDTTGTWATGNTGGLFVLLNLGNGPTLLSSTTGSWIAGDFRGVTGTTALFANSGATFYTTGWQLEVGSFATGFDNRPYGTELLLCMRYMYAIRSVNAANGDGTGMTGTVSGGNPSRVQAPHPVIMRSSPSLTFSNISGAGTDFRAWDGSTVANVSSVGTNFSNPNAIQFDANSVGAPLALGRGCALLWQNSINGGYVFVSAEL